MIEEALSVLGLSWPASPERVRLAYRRRALESHPDTGGSNEEFRRLHEAYLIMTEEFGRGGVTPTTREK